MRDSDAALARVLAVAVLGPHGLLDRRQVALEHLAVALDADVELLARRGLHAVLDVLPVAHRVAIDLDDPVAGLRGPRAAATPLSSTSPITGAPTIVWPAKNTK